MGGILYKGGVAHVGVGLASGPKRALRCNALSIRYKITANSTKWLFSRVIYLSCRVVVRQLVPMCRVSKRPAKVLILGMLPIALVFSVQKPALLILFIGADLTLAESIVPPCRILCVH